MIITIRCAKLQTNSSTWSDLTKPFDLEELKAAVGMLKPGKAAGIHEVLAEMIQHLGTKAKTWLLAMLNSCMAQKTTPPVWRKAKTVIIPKPGKDPSSPQSYRPFPSSALHWITTSTRGCYSNSLCHLQTLQTPSMTPSAVTCARYRQNHISECNGLEDDQIDTRHTCDRIFHKTGCHDIYTPDICIYLIWQLKYSILLYFKTYFNTTNRTTHCKYYW